MKAIAILTLCLMLSLLLALPVLGVDVQAEQAAALELNEVIEALPPEVEEYMGDVKISESAKQAGNILIRLREAARDMLGRYLKDATGSAAAMLTVVTLCSLAGSLDSGGKAPAYVRLAAVAAIAVVAVSDMHSFLGQGLETLRTLSDFSKALLPCLAAAATATGALTSAAAKYAATALYMDLLLNLASQIILPVVYGFAALNIVNAAVGGQALGAAAKLMKWLCRALMTVMTLAFTVYLLVSGVIAGNADAVATRLVKTTVSSALPIVGSIISDAAGTLAAGISVLKGAIGVYGMLAVLSVCLAPFLRLGLHFLIYKAAAGVASCMSDSSLAGLIDSLGAAFGMVLSLVGCCALFLFVSMFSLIKTVV